MYQRQRNTQTHTAHLPEAVDEDGTVVAACAVDPGEEIDWPWRLVGFEGWVDPEEPKPEGEPAGEAEPETEPEAEPAPDPAAEIEPQEAEAPKPAAAKPARRAATAAADAKEATP